MAKQFQFSLSRPDPEVISLGRRGKMAQERHLERLKEAYNKQLFDLIKSGDFLVGSADGKKVILVPNRFLELPRFKFNESKQQQIGQGRGNSKAGDKLGQSVSNKGAEGQGGGNPGQDSYEVEIPFSVLMEWLMPNFVLPRLKPKPRQKTSAPQLVFDDVVKKKSMSNLDKKRTYLEAMKRTAIKTGKPTPVRFTDEDLRVRTWNIAHTQDNNAVIFCVADRSGSIGVDMLALQKIFYWWTIRAAEKQYSNVEICFITFHTEAKERTDQEFWLLRSDGGTKVESGMTLAQEIIRKKYSVNAWNIYLYLASDGESYGRDDNVNSAKIGEALLKEGINQFGYLEIKPGTSSYSQLMQTFNGSLDNYRKKGQFVSVLAGDLAGLRRGMEEIFKE